MLYNFKRIPVVPTSTEFLDIVLSKTQRKTPTVIHPGYKITRIRNFYMRKVKFAQDAFDEKLDAILNEFPKLDEIHPFYSDLMNVLYDRDHYKLALGQLNTCKHLIDSVAKDYARLLKYGDSLFRCKQLKKAALGRMATIMKRQKDSLAYLEQVRQHLSRLPSIDPTTRTLLVCGFPNVGKSSFMNKVTRAQVDVQPYAFTTKSLFVGHMDYKYLRWQVLDTPGILDHALEHRNTIEMQSITALAHLRACILFFIDLSEECGYSIKDQCSLFHSIKPLFANKPTFLIVNKIDVMKPEQLSPENKAILDEITKDVEMLQLSCFTDEGVMDVRNHCCDALLADRVELKINVGRVGNDVLSRLHVTQPESRDEKTRTPFIPESMKHRVRMDTDENPRKLERDLEIEQGGPGVYNIDLNKKYDLKCDEWKYDVIPEIVNGKNVADFIDPDIEAKLEALEREEDRLIEQGFYEIEPEEDLNSDEEAIKEGAKAVREKKSLMIQRHRMSKSQNVKPVPRVARTRQVSELKRDFESIGLDSTSVQTHSRAKRARSESRGVSVARSESVSNMSKRSHSVVRDRSQSGLKQVQKKTVEEIKKNYQKKRNMLAKSGEADRVILTKKPKHLFSGKRTMGKTDRR